MAFQTFITRVLIALVCGLIIGFERQWHNKNAGSQTNALVATGAAIFVTLSFNLEILNGDVTRIIAQVVTGIGFLGAGVIIQRGGDVRGLTTAATIWTSSAIGCLAGAGYTPEALSCSIIIVVLNFVFHQGKKHFESKDKTYENNVPEKVEEQKPPNQLS